MRYTLVNSGIRSHTPCFSLDSTSSLDSSQFLVYADSESFGGGGGREGGGESPSSQVITAHTHSVKVGRRGRELDTTFQILSVDITK